MTAIKCVKGKPFPMPSRAELMELREMGLTRDEIAERFGVSLSLVKLWVKRLNCRIDSRAVPRRPSLKARNTDDLELDDEAGLLPLEIAKKRLSGRWSERHGSYYLDGKVARTDQLLAAAGVALPKLNNDF